MTRSVNPTKNCLSFEITGVKGLSEAASQTSFKDMRSLDVETEVTEAKVQLSSRQPNDSDYERRMNGKVNNM